MAAEGVTVVTVNRVVAKSEGLAQALVRRSPSVALPWDVRQKSRFSAHDSAGREVHVFLARGTVVRGGDALLSTDGSLIRVEAATQAVLEIRAARPHANPFALMRAAYHLGNRHVPIDLQPERIRIEPDHVLQAMLNSMGLETQLTQAPFEPEAGAYGQHGHSH